MPRLSLFLLLVLGCQGAPTPVSPALAPMPDSHVASTEVAPERDAPVSMQELENEQKIDSACQRASGGCRHDEGSSTSMVAGEDAPCPVRLDEGAVDGVSSHSWRAKQWSDAALDGGALYLPGGRSVEEVSGAVEVWVKGCGLLQVERAVIRENRDVFADSMVSDVVMLELDYELGESDGTRELVLAIRSSGDPWRFELLRVDHHERASYYRFDTRPMTFLLSGSFGEEGSSTYMRYEVLEELTGRGESRSSTSVQITVLFDFDGHVTHTWIDGEKRRDFQDNDDLGGKDIEEWGHCEADVTFDRKGRLVANVVEKEGGTDIKKSVKKRTLRLDTKDVSPTTLIRLCSSPRP